MLLPVSIRELHSQIANNIDKSGNYIVARTFLKDVF